MYVLQRLVSACISTPANVNLSSKGLSKILLDSAYPSTLFIEQTAKDVQLERIGRC